MGKKQDSLVNWNVEMFIRIMKQIEARRQASKKVPCNRKGFGHSASSLAQEGVLPETPLDEVREIIHLPAFDEGLMEKVVDAKDVLIPAVVIRQLHHLVCVISTLYNDNPFHSKLRAEAAFLPIFKSS
jgi:hypothetical protein